MGDWSLRRSWKTSLTQSIQKDSKSPTLAIGQIAQKAFGGELMKYCPVALISIVFQHLHNGISETLWPCNIHLTGNVDTNEHSK